MSNPGQQAGPGLPGDLQTPLGITPTTGQITVDQQRNQMLANIAKSLSIFAIGGTVSGNLAVTGTFTPNSVKGIVGTITNDNAQAGSDGEYISSTVLAGAAVGLTTAMPANITSIILTAGDWNVWGFLGATGNAATTVSYVVGSISSTTATIDTSGGRRGAHSFNNATVFAILNPEFSCGSTRFSLASTTTIYLVAQAGFATNTLSSYGFIGARRVR